MYCKNIDNKSSESAITNLNTQLRKDESVSLKHWSHLLFSRDFIILFRDSVLLLSVHAVSAVPNISTYLQDRNTDPHRPLGSEAQI